MALAGADLGMWDWNVPGSTAVYNERWASMLGFALEEVSKLGAFWEDRIHPEDYSRVMLTLRDHLEGRTPGYEAEYRLRHKSGTWVWVLARGRIIRRDEGGKPVRVCGTHLDVTDRKRAEEERERLHGQLMQAQKMESIGQLAGGVAHDFNNMLGVILGHTTMALESISRGDPLHGTLTEIHKAAQRSAELTRQLLAFARKQNVTPKVVDLNTTVGGTLSFLQRLIGEDIRLEWVPSAGLWPVRIDPTQVDQVLANLCANSRDAISGGGSVTIEAANVLFDPAYCDHHPGYASGQYVCLSVSDTGVGMSAEIQAHVFEPFFTSKGLGKGTGLGLATVYGIVKQNNGFISVYSEVGQGTTFRVYFPRYTGSGAAVRPRGPSGAPRGGGETLLVVEDEPSILKMAVRMLEGLGYTVLSAASPGEALRVADERKGAIHLLLSDVVMPGMNGLELSRRLRSRFPGVRVMLMSGYTANVIARHGALDKDMGFVAKPFSVHELAAKVREALEEEVSADGAGGAAAPASA
jgi:two-component system cell cycle sensor histidine kinase/response regulator CckA